MADPIETPPTATAYRENDGTVSYDGPLDKNTTIKSGSDPIAAQADANAPDNVDVGGGFNPATGSPGITPNAPVIAKSNTVATNASSATAAQTSALASKFTQSKDWRVRISLAPGSDYLYNAQQAGILAPLKATNGVIFPYSPAISVGYSASYASYDLTHSNYKSYTYQNSSVDQITIAGDFTAQDTTEANYLLAVIHFFRSATKMFYGQDASPIRGTPPPLVYLSGYGAYQFDNHPMVITNFQYSLPNDVDYISASVTSDAAGVSGNASLTAAQEEAKQSKYSLNNIFFKLCKRSSKTSYIWITSWRAATNSCILEWRQRH